VDAGAPGVDRAAGLRRTGAKPVVATYRGGLAAREAELTAIEAELAQWAVAPPLATTVAKLGAYRGIAQLTAMTLATEVVDWRSSSRGDFHPPALTDPGVNLSIHRALVILVTRTWGPMPNGRRPGDTGE
jgi:hypothetical protein